jgi:hypothetical protein
MHLEFQLSAKRLEKRDVPAPLMPKRKRPADTDAVDLPKIQRELANELFARRLTELAREMNQQRGIDSQRFDFPQLLPQRVNQQWRLFRRKNCGGMPVERDRERNPLVLPRVGNRLPDHLLVPQVHPVEHADGHADLPAARLEFARLPDQLHVIPARITSGTESPVSPIQTDSVRALCPKRSRHSPRTFPM